uniref:L1 transposable element dsRBD-like domain-containing protein n=1 Tax=Pipistrellus kuhlii TaxID=59472 RepID=A0A7J7ZJU6_PIPKU|nr:hypothetical protein mPipKuh1_009633 [Pipistrellus kuhlii]
MANINDRERILKAIRERQRVTYKGAPIRLSNDFSTETHQARQEWNAVYKVLESKELNPRILYPSRLSFKIEGEIRSFTNKQTNKQNKTKQNKKAKGVYHHQTSNARNAKGDSIKRRNKKVRRAETGLAQW